MHPVYDLSLKDDLLTGANEIATFIGWPRRRIYYAADKGYLPIKRIGQLLIARKSELNRVLSVEPHLARAPLQERDL
jgi:hypothetical protein